MNIDQIRIKTLNHSNTCHEVWEFLSQMRSPAKRCFSLLLLTCGVLFACKTQTDLAQKITDTTINAHGGQHYEQFKVSFRFREAVYTLQRDFGMFEYSRVLSDTLGNLYQDVLYNEGFFRIKNGDTLDLDEKAYIALSSSVNSVAYFALLPQPLNDPAVIVEYMGERVVREAPVHLLKVTFLEEGGGKDFDDVFYYWINQNTGFIDFFAYEYHINRGGVRFREAYNRQTVAGIVWQDYRNFKPTDNTHTPDELMAQFLSGEMELVSDIKLESLKALD